MLEVRDPNDPLPRKFGVYAGVVVNRDDPRGIGRIRVRIPGLHEPSGPWALPLGTLGAAPNMGAFWVPEEGAECAILFAQGDPDHPYYLTANWTIGSVPDEAKGPDGKGDPDVRVISTENFAIVIDERTTSPGLKLLHRPSGDVLEYDGIIRQWSLVATASIALQSLGQIDIQGTVVTINGRVVLPSGEPI